MSASHLASAARRLGQDAVTAEVVTAMRARGVRPLLIKGPVLERWLYPDAERRYGDVDLVVCAEQFTDAEAALAGLGFVLALDPATHLGHADHEHVWVRGPDVIDLHRAIWGLDGEPQVVWRTLTEGSDRIEIAHAQVEVVRDAVSAVLVVLHAVQHGGAAKPTEDLRRALAIADERLWRDAASVAGRLGAVGPFVLGLELLPAGRDLARRLQLPPSTSVEAHLFAAGETELASAFQRLAKIRTWRGRLAMLGDELWPSVHWMRSQGRFARRPRGLLAARAWRIASLCARAPRAWLAWRRAVAAAGRAGARGSAPPRRMSAGRKLALGAEILLAYGRARRRMAREGNARTLVALTRGAPAGERGSAAIDIAQARRLGRAVRRALWMLPEQRGCLARSLVLIDLLQRRGARATLVIGARADPTFRAHAWVELAGEPLLSPGGYGASRLAEL